MRRERAIEALRAARGRMAAACAEAMRRAPGWARTAAAFARRRPEAVLAAGLLAGVAAMVAHWS
jgi:hypothetical protein